MKKIWAMYRIHLHEALAFRGQLLFYVIITVLSFTLAYFLWTAIFSEQSEVAGYSLEAMLTYYFLATLFENIAAVWIEFGMERTVRDGTLTSYLMRPMNFLLFQLMDVLAWKTMYTAVVLVVYTVLAVVMTGQLQLQADPAIAFMTVIAVAASLTCFFFISFLISLTSFWLLKIDSVVSILRYSLIPLLSGAFVPVALFPSGVRQVLQFTPFPYLVGFSANVYLGRVQIGEFLLGLTMLTLWTAVLFFLWRIGWRKALKQYESVGA